MQQLEKSLRIGAFVLTGLLQYLPSRQDYNLKFFKEDLLAGLTVAIVALPWPWPSV